MEHTFDHPDFHIVSRSLFWAGPKDPDHFRKLEDYINKYNTDAKCSQGMTVLMKAVISRDIETIKYLKDKKADPSIKCLKGLDSYDYAKRLPIDPFLKERIVKILSGS